MTPVNGTGTMRILNRVSEGIHAANAYRSVFRPPTPLIVITLPVSTDGVPSSSGRDSQSNRFFSDPGTLWLYSGVKIQIASASFTATRASATDLGVGNSSS